MEKNELKTDDGNLLVALTQEEADEFTKDLQMVLDKHHVGFLPVIVPISASQVKAELHQYKIVAPETPSEETK